MSFFLFSFQVHEKHILLPLTALSLFALEAPWLVLWLNTVAAFSMFPLLRREGSELAYYGLQGLNFWLHGGFELFSSEKGSGVKYRYQQLFAGATILQLLICHVIFEFAPSPDRYPDIYVYMITGLSFAHLVGIYAVLAYLSASS